VRDTMKDLHSLQRDPSRTLPGSASGTSLAPGRDDISDGMAWREQQPGIIPALIVTGAGSWYNLTCQFPRPLSVSRQGRFMWTLPT
jgi:hypothetical protein